MKADEFKKRLLELLHEAAGDLTVDSFNASFFYSLDIGSVVMGKKRVPVWFGKSGFWVGRKKHFASTEELAEFVSQRRAKVRSSIFTEDDYAKEAAAFAKVMELGPMVTPPRKWWLHHDCIQIAPSIFIDIQHHITAAKPHIGRPWVEVGRYINCIRIHHINGQSLYLKATNWFKPSNLTAKLKKIMSKEESA